MTRICIVEDDNAVAASLQAMLLSWGFETCMSQTGEAFLADHPTELDCVLLDVRLPGRDGLSVLSEFRESDTSTPVIVITGHGDVRTAVLALQSGAQDFVEKPFDGADLVERLRTAIDRSSPASKCRRRLDALTPREAEVLRELVAGHPNKVIAFRLNISPKTVELHRARVMDKMEAHSLSHLVRMALKGGMEVELDLGS
ncbi:MAG: response regulator [Pseudomonadota bacterium]